MFGEYKKEIFLASIKVTPESNLFCCAISVTFNNSFDIQRRRLVLKIRKWKIYVSKWFSMFNNFVNILLFFALIMKYHLSHWRLLILYLRKICSLYEASEEVCFDNCEEILFYFLHTNSFPYARAYINTIA